MISVNLTNDVTDSDIVQDVSLFNPPRVHFSLCTLRSHYSVIWRGGSRISHSISRGANPPWACTYDFAKFSKKSCMKLRKFWVGGGRLLDPPMICDKREHL